MRSKFCGVKVASRNGRTSKGAFSPVKGTCAGVWPTEEEEAGEEVAGVGRLDSTEQDAVVSAELGRLS